MQIGNKVAWFSSGEKTSFGKVRLKHRELFLDKEAETASVETLEKAYSTLRATIASFSRPGEQKLADGMQRYFKSNVRKITTVQPILELVQNGMTSGKLAFKTDNTSASRFTGALGVQANIVPYIEGYVRNGANNTKGDIHVKRDYILNNRYQAVRTFIHEATHRFAGTADFGEQGYMHADGSDFRAPGITAEQCLNNADSYAYFCMYMGYK